MLEVRCSTNVGPKLLVITYFSGIKKASEGVGQTLGGLETIFGDNNLLKKIRREPLQRPAAFIKRCPAGADSLKPHFFRDVGRQAVSLHRIPY